MVSPTTYPLCWPPGIDRQKTRLASPFRVQLGRALSDLRDALRLFGSDTGKPVSEVIISSNVTLGAHCPADPGVAVYFMWDGAQRCIAVDRYAKVEDNVRAIYYVLEGRRTELRYGGLSMVRASFRGFVALPPPDDWRSALGFQPGARPTLDAVNEQYRRRARELHPDATGGSPEAMAALNAAVAAARKELGA